MSEEAATAAGDLATVRRLTKQVQLAEAESSLLRTVAEELLGCLPANDPTAEAAREILDNRRAGQDMLEHIETLGANAALLHAHVGQAVAVIEAATKTVSGPDATNYAALAEQIDRYHKLPTLPELPQSGEVLLRELTELRMEVKRLTILWEGQSRLTNEAQERAERAEADAAALRLGLLYIRNGAQKAGAYWWDAAAAAALDQNNAGAALLAELEAARAVVACYRQQPHYYDDCDPGQNDPYYEWYARMSELMLAYDQAAKGEQADA